MPEFIEPELDTVRVLIGQAQEGDPAAQSELAAHVQSYLNMMADRNLSERVRTNVGPSDIVQQTLIRMVNGIDDFKGDSTREFFGWLNQIIKNEARRADRDLTRQKRDVRRDQSLGRDASQSRPQPELEDGLLTPQSNAIANERIELFYQALEKLSDDYATVIRLRSLEQLAFDEIASRMNRTIDSVTKMWCRAVVKFEKELSVLNDNSQQR